MNDEPTKAQKLEVKKKKEEVVRKAMTERRMPRPDELMATEAEIDFKLGDASIAAPFTNKHSNSIKCVETVLKQGVCTLSCGMQSYKIVTLSSFLTAYSLSKLHMENLKFSDMQNTLMSMYGAYLYYQLSNGKPVKRLSKDRPPNSIFNRYFWMSLFGQLAIQLVFTFLIGRFASAYKPAEDAAVDNEDEFVPTFTNSVMFVFDLASMFCISIFNYEGRPYMISLSENKKHFKFLMLPIALLGLLIFEVIEDINGLFQMTLVSPFKDVQTSLFTIVFGFIACSFLWTLFVRKLQHGKVERII
jgi:cation-transporting ATPase 13A1